MPLLAICQVPDVCRMIPAGPPAKQVLSSGQLIDQIPSNRELVVQDDPFHVAIKVGALPLSLIVRQWLSDGQEIPLSGVIRAFCGSGTCCWAHVLGPTSATFPPTATHALFEK